MLKTVHLLKDESKEAKISLPENDKSLHKRTATIFGCTFNMVATILGNGLLSLPYAMAGCGVWIGLVAFVIVMILSNYCFLTLSKAVKTMPGGCEFKDLGKLCLPPRFNWLVDLTVCINCFLCACGHLIVPSTLLPEIVESLSSESPPRFLTNRLF